MANKFLDNTGLSYLWGKIKAGLEAKQNKLTGTQGQMVGFNASGEAVAEDMPNGMEFKNVYLEMPQAVTYRIIMYGNGRFVAVSPPAYNKPEADVAYSDDGINWIETTLPETLINKSWRNGSYAGGKYILVSASGTVAYSEDGLAWNTAEIPAPTGDSSINWRDVVYGGDRFVAVGIGSSDSGSQVSGVWSAYSMDGIEWTLSSRHASLSGGYKIAYGNGVFVTIGGTRPAYSTDGVTWTNCDRIIGVTDTEEISYGNNVFVVCYGKTSSYCFMRSTDGINWETNESYILTNSTEIAYGDGKFVAFDKDQSSSTIIYSMDGITWTSTGVSVSGLWSYISYEGGRFIATRLGNIIYSYDGITWYNSAKVIIDFSGTDITSDVADALGVSDKQDKVTGQDSQLAGFDENGNLTPLSDVAMAGSFTLMGEFTTNQKMTAMNGVDLSAQSLFNNFADTDAVSKQYVDRRYFYITIDIPTTGWTDNQQTFTVDGIPADASDHVVMLAQEGATNVAAAEACGIRIVNEAENSLTLKVNSVPEAAFQVNAVVWNILERSPYWM